MHRLILDAQPGQIVDHVNYNGLDNRRINIRLCTSGQNSMNTRCFASWKTSKFKGVHIRENGNWRAAIRVNGKLLNIGTYPTQELAAAAYNSKARFLFGDFAVMNNVPEQLEPEAAKVVDGYKWRNPAKFGAHL
jgi:hypothetical protein